LAFCKAFDHDLVVVLDGPPDFQLSAVTHWRPVTASRLSRFPSSSQDSNPVEER
jgi:hypothetical protein